MGRARIIALAGMLAGAVAVAGPAAAATPAASTAAGHDRDSHLPRFDYYLALGDSLASGVQPDSSGQDVVTSQGYASDIAADLQKRDRDLKFVNLSCPGESTGTMLNGGRAHLLDAPHLTIFPGLAIALLVLGFNFRGDGLRDATDPKRAPDRRA